MLSGTDGFQLRTINHITHDPDGGLLHLKAGDLVQLHGSKVRRAVGSDGSQVFPAQKLSHDFARANL